VTATPRPWPRQGADHQVFGRRRFHRGSGVQDYGRGRGGGRSGHGAALSGN
jgi:hypothetical protein